MQTSVFKKSTNNEDLVLVKRLEEDIPFQVGKMLVQARVLRGVTQQDLADLAETKQSGISRIESGTNMPSLSFLKKLVDAMGMTLLPPRIAEVEEVSNAFYYSVSCMNLDPRRSLISYPTENSTLTSNNFVTA